MARGGKRENAGRKPGSVSKLTAELKSTLTDIAQEHTVEAVGTLVKVMSDKKATASARVMASNAILDRGWGKAPQSIEHKGDALGGVAERLANALTRIADNTDPHEAPDAQERPHRRAPRKRDARKPARKGRHNRA